MANDAHAFTAGHSLCRYPTWFMNAGEQLVSAGEDACTADLQNPCRIAIEGVVNRLRRRVEILQNAPGNGLGDALLPSRVAQLSHIRRPSNKAQL